MRRRYFLGCLSVFAMLFVGCSEEETVELPMEEAEVAMELTPQELAVAREMTTFNYGFLGDVDRSRKTRDDNLLISPLSAQMLLGLLGDASDASAANEMASAIGCGDISSLSTLNKKIRACLPKLDPKATVSFANSVWYNRNYSLTPEFLRKAEGSVEVYGRDLKNALDEINEWCARNTNNMIPEYFKSADELGYYITFLNAMYFKGEWTDKFDRESTTDATFHGAKGDAQVPMMEATRTVAYYSCDEFESVDLPFGNEKFYARFVLPKEGADINQVVDCAATKVSSAKVSHQWCYIKLPKFKLEGEKLSLLEAMNSIGVKQIFHGGHLKVFSEAINDDLMLDMKQKSIVEIDESGAVIAAVTSSSADYASGMPDIVVFDRPFLFFVIAKESGSCLLAGKVMDI